MIELQTSIEQVRGFQAAGVACGLKEGSALDLALIASETPCAAAGLFTTNHVKAAPVLLDQKRLAQNAAGIRAVVINAGNANACTGARGLQDAEQTAAWVAEELECGVGDVLVMSTGVIGVPLPMHPIERGVIDAAISLRADGWDGAARAIMTTDTTPKMASVRVTTDQGTCTVAGMAKGAGMIAPDMATLLVLLVTDAALDAATLHETLASATAASFNRIVVDGDMSTNDTVLLLANGASGVRVEDGATLAAFQEALTAVCLHLAKSIVRDGEGATRFITLEVVGAPDETAARRVAMAIATSPLVKTAFYGGDANWGRILAAAGRAGVAVDPDRMALYVLAGEDGALGGLCLVQDGAPAAYDEATATEVVSQAAFSVRLDLGLGQAAITVWTCDLSHDYVTINGHYRT